MGGLTEQAKQNGYSCKSLEMWGVIWLALSLVSGQQGFEVCSQPFASEGSCLDLDLALFQANGRMFTELVLQTQGQIFVLTEAITLVSHVIIHGNLQLLLLRESISIQNSAELDLLQVNISSAHLVPAFTVLGTLYWEECVVAGLSAPLAEVFGNFTVTRSWFEENRREVMLVGRKKAVIYLEKVRISSQIGTFFAANLKPADFFMRNCTITKAVSLISSAFFRFSFPTDTEAGAAVISDLIYQDNQAVAFEINVNAYKMEITRCEFSRNEGSTLTGYMTNSIFNITSSIWSNNTGIIIRIYGISGQFLASNSHFSHQFDGGFVQIAGNSASLCFLSLSNSSFTHTNVTLTAASPGVLALSACTAEVSDLVVTNVRFMAETYSDQQGLIYATSAVLRLTNLLLMDSGSSGMVVLMGNGDLNMGNCVLRNPFTAQNLYIGVMLGTAEIANVTIEGGEAVLSKNDIMLGYVDPIYFYFMQATASLADLRVTKQTLYHTGATVCFFFSDFRLFGLYVRDLIQYFVLLVASSSGIVTNLDVQNVDLDFYVCQAASYTDLTVSNGVIKALAPNARRKAVFFMSSYCNMTVSHMFLSDLVAPTVISSKSSRFEGDFLRIINCSFHELTQYPLDSRISFHHLLFEESIGGLASGMESYISFADSYIREVRSETGYLRCFMSAVQIINLTIAGYYSHLQLGHFSESSSLSILNSRFSAFGSNDGRGFLFQDGTITIANSSFSGFNISLFQGSGMSVTLENSSFRGGWNTITSRKSDNAYGGVLGCVDCRGVKISGVTVSNVTSVAGGVLSLRQRKGSSTRLEIDNSSFMLNSAQQGGAIYLRNVSFDVVNCSFFSNTAVKGGAIFASTRPSHHSLISSTLFSYNSATEGGAIKWDNAQIYLINVSFRGNIADYGPDVASYGVSLSSRLTKLPESPVSGVPLSLTFELLDHYGARVSLEKEKALTLLSTPTLSYLGNSVSFINSGLFSFPSLTIYAPPGSVQTLTASLSYSQGDFSLSLLTSLPIPFRNCTSGEIYRPDRCEYCYAGNFSFDPTDSSCSFCPRNAMCGGGSHIAVSPHYWKAEVKSTNIVRCGLPGLCLGGNYSRCEEGYEGKTCSMCREQAYRFAGVKCRECQGIAAICIHLVALCAVIIVFLYAFCHFSIKSEDPSKLFVLKTVITHSQLLSATAYLRIILPDPIAYTIHAASYLSTLGITDIPLACAGISDVETVKAVLGSLFCPAIILISLLFAFCKCNLHPKFPIFLLTSLLLLAPVVATLTLTPLLACVQIDSAQEWQYTNTYQACWTPFHLLLIYTLLLPAAFLTLILPISLLIALLIAKPELYKRYFPLWECGHKALYWELFHLLGRVIYAGLMIRAVMHDQLVQICSGLSVLIVVCVLNVAFFEGAYSSKGLFFLAESSLALVAVSLGLEGYLIYDYAAESNRSRAISGLFVGLNGSFYAICVYLLLKKKKNTVAIVNLATQIPALPVPNNSFA